MRKSIYTVVCMTAMAISPFTFAKTAKTKLALTMSQAESMALKTQPGTIQSKELEREHGKLIYSFDVKTESDGIHEININARTGKLIEDKKESPASEAKEKKMDEQQQKKRARKKK